MTSVYRRARVDPLRKVYYNLVVTAVSMIGAFALAWLSAAPRGRLRSPATPAGHS